MGFFSFFQNLVGPGVISSTMASADAVAHPVLYYKERDVIIINRLRLCYTETFTGDAIPSCLRYQHEPSIPPRSGEIDYTVEASPKPPQAKYQPTCNFPDEHKNSMKQIVKGGSSNIKTECNSAIALIYDYLNALNFDENGKKTDTVIARMLHNYGHRNDAVRVLFLLLVDAFNELFNLDTNDIDCLATAEKHLDFLGKLCFDQELTNALSDIDPVDLNDKNQNVLPVALLADMGTKLENIKKNIILHLSKFSLAKHIEAISAELGEYIQCNYVFFVYIISTSSFKECHLQPCEKDEPQNNTMIEKLRCELSKYIHNATSNLISTKSAHSKHTPLITNASTITTVSPPYFDYAPATQEWVGFTELLDLHVRAQKQTGVYLPFIQDKDLMHYFFNFAGYLKTTVRNLQGFSVQKCLLDSIGDIGGILKLQESINLQLDSIRDTKKQINDNRKKLFSFAQAHYKSINGVNTKHKKINANTKQWMTNCSNFVRNYQGDLPGLSGKIDARSNQITAIIETWIQNPQQNLENLGENAKILSLILSEIGLSMSHSNKHYIERAQKIITETLNGFSLFTLTTQQTPSPTFLQKPQQSSTMEEISDADEQTDIISPLLINIKKLFTDYNFEHGYENGVPTKIIQLDKDQHDKRAEWIKSCEQILENPQKTHSADEILEELDGKINALIAPGNYEKTIAKHSSAFHKKLVLSIQLDIKNAQLKISELKIKAMRITTHQPSLAIEAPKIQPNKTILLSKPAIQLGWNCFDIAIGNIQRDDIVHYALMLRDDSAVRALLTEEIKSALILTVLYFKQKRLNETLKREATLLPIEMDKDKDIMIQLYDQIEETLNASEAKTIISDCKKQIGSTAEKPISIEDLKLLVRKAITQKPYPAVYDKFLAFNEQVQQAEKELHDYCSSIMIYEVYVTKYYGNNAWFTFDRKSNNNQTAGMIDIVAKMLSAKIIIHSDKNVTDLFYETKSYGPKEIHVEYNGKNHFLALSATKLKKYNQWLDVIKQQAPTSEPSLPATPKKILNEQVSRPPDVGVTEVTESQALSNTGKDLTIELLLQEDSLLAITYSQKEEEEPPLLQPANDEKLFDCSNKIPTMKAPQKTMSSTQDKKVALPKKPTIQPNESEKKMPTSLRETYQIALHDKTAAYNFVFEIQDLLKKVEYIKDELDSKGKIRKLTPNKIKAIETLRIACEEIDKLKETRCLSTFHNHLITQVLMPYRQLVSVGRNISNGWHMNWTDKSLYPIQHYLAPLAQVLIKIQDSKVKFETIHISLINMCLAEFLRKLVCSLPYHQEANALYIRLNDYKERIVPREIVLDLVTVKGTELYKIMDENDLLREENELLKKEVADAKEGEAQAKEREAQAKEGEAQAKEGEAQAKEGEAQAKEGEAQAKEGEAQAKEETKIAQEQIVEAKIEKELLINIVEGYKDLIAKQSELMEKQNSQLEIRDDQIKILEKKLFEASNEAPKTPTNTASQKAFFQPSTEDKQFSSNHESESPNQKGL